MPQNIDKIVVPSLDPDGWVFSGERQADYLMAYFLASDKSQSYIHGQYVKSFAWYLAIYNSNYSRLVTEVQKALNELFTAYFNNVLVQCTDASLPEKPNEFILTIAIRYQTADGNYNDVVRVASLIGSKFKLINDAIVTGPS